MKTKTIILIVAAVLFLVSSIYFLINQTLYQSHFISTVANEPTLPYGSIAHSSSLFSAAPGDFVIFNHKTKLFQLENKNFPIIFRLIAMENDTVQIKKGTVYVNGENFDQNYTLKNQYRIHEDSLLAIDKYLGPMDYQYPNDRSLDYIFIHAIDSLADRYLLKQNLVAENQGDAMIEEVYNKFWNKDKFGPLVIPEGSLFVMGDNRDNAMDSRFLGCIDQERLIGVVKDRRKNK